jgi:hypothetical protein
MNQGEAEPVFDVHSLTLRRPRRRLYRVYSWRGTQWDQYCTRLVYFRYKTTRRPPVYCSRACLRAEACEIIAYRRARAALVRLRHYLWTQHGIGQRGGYRHGRRQVTAGSA